MAKIKFDVSKIDLSEYQLSDDAFVYRPTTQKETYQIKIPDNMNNFDSEAKFGLFSILVIAFVGIFLCVKCCMSLDGDTTYTTNTSSYSTAKHYPGDPNYTPSTEYTWNESTPTTTSASYSSSSSPYLEIGKSYKIVSNTIVGSTKSNLKEIYSYALNGNSEGMVAMALLGQGTILSCATVSIADYDGRTVKLRIINDGVTGEANGYYCYAFQSDIRKNTTKL